MSPYYHKYYGAASDSLGFEFSRNVIIIFLFAMPFAALLTYFERKWSALIQDRVGPSRKYWKIEI